MLGFGKRKKTEEEIEEVSVKKASKKNKKTEKKRKEPIRPWGRKERLMVVVVVFGTAVFAGLLGLSSRSWKLPGLPRIVSSDMSIGKTFVIESDEVKDKISSGILGKYSNLTKELAGVYGFYVARLYQDKSYGELEDEQFSSAGLMHLPLMVAIYMEAEEGRIFLSQHQELLQRLSDVNDDTAYAEALDLIGKQKFTQIVKEIGMSKTSVQDDLTTPADMGKLLRKLWEGRLVNSTHQADIFEFFYFQPEDGINVVRIFGDKEHVINSAEIVFSKSQPMVIIVMSKGIIDSEANLFVPQFRNSIFSAES